jgi:hypothetical protein
LNLYKTLHSHASVSVLPRRAGKNSPASFSFNNLEIERYQNARLTSGSHPGAQLRETIEATADLIHETHKCFSKSWSYLKHDPPEWPAFDLVSQGFRCVLKSEGPRNDRFNRSRFEQRTNRFPGCPPHLGWLCKQRETLYAGALPNEIGNIDGRFTASGIA